jgi:hypothetical protein
LQHYGRGTPERQGRFWAINYLAKLVWILSMLAALPFAQLDSSLAHNAAMVKYSAYASGAAWL